MKIARIRGIDVHIHWTFWLLIIFYLLSVAQSDGWAGGFAAVIFVFSIFFCVLLHEFGHAFAAKWYGILTLDITLLPIGGVARLQRMPEKPSQELVVALAGPAVNVVIAVVLLLPVTLGVMSSMAAPAIGIGTTFFAQLLVVNIMLVCFNLLPVFPMDGGRVLRSLLALRMGHFRATQIAARIGRWLALAMALWAVWNFNFMLLLLAGFVFIAGTSELIQAKMRAVQGQMEMQYGQPRAWHFWQGSWSAQAPQWPSDRQFDDSDVIDAVEVRQLP